MSHVIEKHENHIYIKMLSPTFEFRNNKSFINEILAAQQNNPNLVINCASLREIADESAFKVKELYNKNRAKAGHIIISQLSENLIPKMELIGLVCVPSDEEAVDYIFMEQIEQEFLNDWDEEPQG